MAVLLRLISHDRALSQSLGFELTESRLSSNADNLRLFVDLSRFRPNANLIQLHFYSSIVDSYRRRSCQDPRDHLFGLAGIFRHLDSFHAEVDYDRSTSEVYQHAIKELLLGDVNSLIMFQAGSSFSKAVCLPSWVPDFSCRSETRPMPFDRYQAGGTEMDSRLSADSFSPGRGTCSLTGFRFERGQQL